MAHKNKDSLHDIFVECQQTIQSHAKLIKKAIKVYKATEFDTFWEQFVYYMKHALVIFEREPVVERCLEFIAKFATSLNQNEMDQEKTQDEEEENLNEFLIKLFDFCLNHHKASGHAVRFRVCQLVNKLLYKMGEEAEIDDDLFDRIYECMLQRLRDVYPIVRIQAVFALARLQHPEEDDCPIINAYLFLLSGDPNSDVRRAVLTCIAASKKTLPVILERTRDEKDIVRRLSYQVIAEKVHIRALTIAQRITLLQDGLKDRVDFVKDACTNRLLQAWLKTFQGNILELLKCLDVENSVETARLAISSLFSKTPAHELVTSFDLLNDEMVIEVKDLTCESALYWHSLCEHLAGLGVAGEELLEKILPTPTAFSTYLASINEALKGEEDLDIQLTNEFILQQLLEMACVLDLSDEAGRRAIGNVVHDLLVARRTTNSLVPPLVALYCKYQRDPTTRINALCEVIAEIREPIMVVDDPRSKEEKRQLEIKLAQVRVELNQLREELEGSVSHQDFSRAADIKTRVEALEEIKAGLLEESQPRTQEVRTEKTDPETLLQCLTIAAEMLSTVTFRNPLPSLQTLTETLILPGVQNEDPAVRNMAVKSLSMYCQMYASAARAHLVLFITVSQMDADTIKVTALQGIFDMLLTFGLDAFQLDDSSSEDEDKSSEVEERNNTENLDDSSLAMRTISTETSTPPKKTKNTNTASSLLSILTELLSSKVSEVRTVAAEGLAKLLLARHIVSPKLISRLLLLWYNPVTEDDILLRHCLGAFFPIYAFGNFGNQSIVEEAFMPTMRTLFKAPMSSPLAEVDVDNVVELLVQLTNRRHLMNKRAQQDHNCHDGLAVSLCNEILQEPNSCYVRTLCRALNSLELTKDHTGLKDLVVLADSLVKEVKDKRCNKMLVKFHGTVSSMYHGPTVDTTSGSDKQDMEVDATVSNGTQPDRRTSDVSAQPGDACQVEDTRGDSERPGTSQEHQEPPDAGTEETDKDTQDQDLMPGGSNASRTALGQVHTNTPGQKSPESETEPVEVRASDKKQGRPRVSAKSTVASTSRKRSQKQPEAQSGSEMENTVFVTPVAVRRSTRTRKNRTEAESTMQEDVLSDASRSETDSPVKSKARATKSRRGTTRKT